VDSSRPDLEIAQNSTARDRRRIEREAYSQADVLDSGMARHYSLHRLITSPEEVETLDLNAPFVEEYLLNCIQQVQSELNEIREAKNALRRADDSPSASETGSSTAMKSKRLFIVSHRLPVQVQFLSSHDKSKPKILINSSGLQASLRRLRQEYAIRWIGQLMQVHELNPEQQQVTRRILLAEHGFLPLFVDAHLGRRHQIFCNSVLWRIFHYIPVGVEGERAFCTELWEAYCRVNEAYAEALVRECQAGDLIWVHDFQLMLVPQLLRSRQADARIGFFLHTPFPSSEIYRMLPVRRPLLEGMLASDLIGFHTYDYARHFFSVCSRLLGLETRPNGIDNRGADVRVGIYPFSIDSASFVKASRSKAVQDRKRRLLDGPFAGKTILLGIDRLDYIKGIPHKMLAFEQLLELHPEWIGRAVLLQVAVPSAPDLSLDAVDERANSDYLALRAEVEELAGRINGRFGTVEDLPIMYRILAPDLEELVVLYGIADVAVITSLREGMGLMSYEFAVCQAEKHGALVMSEFCGAAHSLPGAILCNPWSIDEVAETLHRAMTISRMERELRYQKLHKYVQTHTADRWAENVIMDLARATENRRQYRRLDVAQLCASFRSSRRRLILLDYDGTLSAYRSQPELAKPGDRVQQILRRLVGHGPDTTVFVISGRERATLDRWLAATGCGLVAEQGYAFCWPSGVDAGLADHSANKESESSAQHDAHRVPASETIHGNQSSEQTAAVSLKANENAQSAGVRHSLAASESRAWQQPLFDYDPETLNRAMHTAVDIMLRFEDHTPGAFTHIKESSVTWHYSEAEPDFAYFQAQELRAHLEESLARSPLEVLSGKNIVYVHPRGIHKGNAVRYILNQLRAQEPDWILCIGDDKSDERMFEACLEHIGERVLSPRASPRFREHLDASKRTTLFTCTVGRKNSLAGAFVERVDDVLECLEKLANWTTPGTAPPEPMTSERESSRP
jgi:trehalose 6-phosphate synthase/phosphatase